jgi:hypothetical protein
MGLAAACKCTPLLFLPLLIWRGRWSTAAVMVLTIAAASHLGDFMNHRANLVCWWNQIIIPSQTGNVVPGGWATESIYNQSIAGACNRWTQTSWEWTPDNVDVIDVANPPPVAHVKLLLRGLQLAVVLAALLAFWNRPFRAGVPERLAGVNRLSVECGLICVLMLLLSPMSNRSHFLIMLLPALCLARWTVELRVPLLRIGLGTVIFCSQLVSKDLVRSRVYTFIHWYGFITFGDLLLGVLIGGMLWRLSQSGVRSEIAPTERITPAAPLRTAA